MGNQRQQLKDRIIIELRNKMENIQTLLDNLKEEQESVQRNCIQAKTHIQNTADVITQQLANRKLALINEVDMRGQMEMKTLQENIQSTYLMLGSLQSTLSNLDSFDNSQLINLQIPNTSSLPRSSKSQWRIDTTCEPLLEKIKNWGVVATADAVSGSEFLEVPAADAKCSSSDFSNACKQGASHKWNIEQWMEAELESDGDEFEMLSMEQEEKLKSDSSCDDSVVPDLEDKASFSEGSRGNDFSSIACMNTGENMETSKSVTSDYSMWLKPRNTVNNSAQTEIPGVAIPTVPPEMIKKSKSATTSTVSSKSRFLDYPGLRLDPRCWLQKPHPDLFKLSVELAMNMSEKEIIPPTFAALPYPFWLKRC